MSNQRPDFHTYSTRELREILGFIDRDKYPDRVEEILHILSERELGRLDEARVGASVDDRRADRAVSSVADTSIKPGRSASLAKGVSAVVFGVLWLAGSLSLMEAAAEPPPTAFKLLFWFAGIATICGGLVSIYNALARNRFTIVDIVDTEQEPDPLSSILDPDKRDRQF